MQSGGLIVLTIIIIIIAAHRRSKTIIKLNQKRGKKMTNELIKSAIGNVCNISTGPWDTGFLKVKIVEVVDNWIKVEKKGKINLINIDHIQSIKLLK